MSLFLSATVVALLAFSTLPLSCVADSEASVASAGTLLDDNYIQKSIMPWRLAFQESHGATYPGYLGFGMLYFTFPYMPKAEVSVPVLHLSFLVSHSQPASYCQSRSRSCSLPILLTSMRHNVQVTSPYSLTQDSPSG